MRFTGIVFRLTPHNPINFSLEIALDMSVDKTAEEVKQNHIEVMGDDLGLALSTGAEPLKPASRAKVKEALGSISNNSKEATGSAW